MTYTKGKANSVLFDRRCSRAHFLRLSKNGGGAPDPPRPLLPFSLQATYSPPLLSVCGQRPIPGDAQGGGAALLLLRHNKRHRPRQWPSGDKECRGGCQQLPHRDAVDWKCAEDRALCLPERNMSLRSPGVSRQLASTTREQLFPLGLGCHYHANRDDLTRRSGFNNNIIVVYSFIKSSMLTQRDRSKSFLSTT